MPVLPSNSGSSIVLILVSLRSVARLALSLILYDEIVFGPVAAVNASNFTRRISFVARGEYPVFLARREISKKSSFCLLSTKN